MNLTIALFVLFCVLTVVSITDRASNNIEYIIASRQVTHLLLMLSILYNCTC